MGRAGGGGGHGGGFSGGGHHSSSFSGGGHRSSFSSSSSSRSGSSRSGSFSGSSSRGGSFSSFKSTSSSKHNHHSPTIVYNNFGGGFGRVSNSVGCGGCSAGLVAIIIIIAIFIIFVMMTSAMGDQSYGGTSSVPASSYDREKLEGTTWTNDCVVDETGWIKEDGSISGLERQLRKFYDKTGIQPYVYLVHNISLKSDDDMTQFAADYYSNHIDNTYTFALFCFAEDDLDGTKYECYMGGAEALGIMDAEAVEIFWAIFDQEWYGSNTTEDCIANIFNRTADRIMTKSTTTNDIVKIVLIIVLVVVIAAAIIIIMNKRRKNEKERNEETRRILETPLE